MMAEIRELYTSRSAEIGLNEKSSVRIYHVLTGAGEDESTVETLTLATAPTTSGGMKRESLKYEHLGGGIFSSQVRYSQKFHKTGWRFSTRGEKVKKFHGTHIRSSVAAGQVPIDFKGAINVTPRGVEGVDVIIPTFNFSVTKRFTVGTVDADYIDDIFQATGGMNSGAFTFTTANGWSKTFLARECLYEGAEGEQVDEYDAELQFYFSASPKALNIPIPGLDPVESKDGWDYLWIYHMEAEDEGSRTIIRRPVQADVVRVIKEVNFADLRL